MRDKFVAIAQPQQPDPVLAPVQSRQMCYAGGRMLERSACLLKNQPMLVYNCPRRWGIGVVHTQAGVNTQIASRYSK